MDNKRILLIDDDAELCGELAEILQDEGYVVQNTSDSVEGERLIEQHEFDIALFDFKISGMSGMDLLKKIKHKRPETKVFLISGRPFLEKLLEEEKLSSLVAGIISKPFKIDILLEKIRS